MSLSSESVRVSLLLFAYSIDCTDNSNLHPIDRDGLFLRDDIHKKSSWLCRDQALNWFSCLSCCDWTKKLFYINGRAKELSTQLYTLVPKLSMLTQTNTQSNTYIAQNWMSWHIFCPTDTSKWKEEGKGSSFLSSFSCYVNR